MIDIAGEQFLDLDQVLVLNHADTPRPSTLGLALHHSATVFTSTVSANEIAYIRSVEKYHVNPPPNGAGFGMFGYNAMAFPSGRVYVKGQCLGKRAHVGGHNHEYAGICMAGDYSTVKPSQPMIEGIARWVRAMRRVHGDVPLRPHGDVTAGTQWSSTCPGQGGRTALAAIDMLADEPAEDEDEMSPEERELLHLVARMVAYTDPEIANDYGAGTGYGDPQIQELLKRSREYVKHYNSVTGRQYAIDGGGPYTP